MEITFMPQFLPGEVVLKESRATRYYQPGRRSSNGKLWLTNQRLIFKAGFGYQMAWPLFNVSQVTTGVYGLLRIKVLHLIFDNGREERFSIHQVENWPQEVLAARAGAPPLPAELEKLSEQEKSARRVALTIIGLVMGVIFLCMAPLLCLIPLLLLPPS